MTSSKLQIANKKHKFSKSQIDYFIKTNSQEEQRTHNNAKHKDQVLFKKLKTVRTITKIRKNKENKKHLMKNDEIVTVNPMEADSKVFLQVMPPILGHMNNMVGDFDDNTKKKSVKTTSSKNLNQQNHRNSQHLTGAVRRIVLSNKNLSGVNKKEVNNKQICLKKHVDLHPQPNAFVHVLSAFLTNDFENTFVDHPNGSIGSVRTLSMSLDDVPEESDVYYENSFAAPPVSIILKRTYKSMGTVTSQDISMTDNLSRASVTKVEVGVQDSDLEEIMEMREKIQSCSVKCDLENENELGSSCGGYENLSTMYENLKHMKMDKEDEIKETYDYNCSEDNIRQFNVKYAPEMLVKETEGDVLEENEQNNLKTKDEDKHGDNCETIASINGSMDISQEQMEKEEEQDLTHVENSKVVDENVDIDSHNDPEISKNFVHEKFRDDNIKVEYKNSKFTEEINFEDINVERGQKESKSFPQLTFRENNYETCRISRLISNVNLSENKKEIITLFSKQIAKNEQKQSESSKYLKINRLKQFERMRKKKLHHRLKNFRNDVIAFLTRSLDDNTRNNHEPKKAWSGPDGNFELVLPSAKLIIPRFSQVMPETGRKIKEQINRFLDEMRLQSTNKYDMGKELILLYAKQFSEMASMC